MMLENVDQKRVLEIAKKAKNASYRLSAVETSTKNNILHDSAEAILSCKDNLISENQKDIELNKDKLTDALLDRLVLDSKRIDGICEGLIAISKLEDPVGKIISSHKTWFSRIHQR